MYDLFHNVRKTVQIITRKRCRASFSTATYCVHHYNLPCQQKPTSGEHQIQGFYQLPCSWTRKGLEHTLTPSNNILPHCTLGCKNRVVPFLWQMSYKATKSGFHFLFLLCYRTSGLPMHVWSYCTGFNFFSTNLSNWHGRTISDWVNSVRSLISVCKYL